MVWTHVINFGLGILLRLWNEERKAKKDADRMQMALLSKKMEVLSNQHERVAGSTFLQFMMMCMVFVAMGVLVVFPLIAAFGDIPLFILHEYVQETGFLFWKSAMVVQEWTQVNGLYLPEEFQMVMIAAIEFIFGAIVGGVGRR